MSNNYAAFLVCHVSKDIFSQTKVRNKGFNRRASRERERERERSKLPLKTLRKVPALLFREIKKEKKKEND